MNLKTLLATSAACGLLAGMAVWFFLVPAVPEAPPEPDRIGLPAPWYLGFAAAPGETDPVKRARSVTAEGEWEEMPDWPSDTVPDELLFSFSSEEELNDFLRRAAREGITGIQALRELLSARVRLADPRDARLLRQLAGPGAHMDFNSFVLTPEPVPPLDEGVGGRRPFGGSFADWMGVPADNARWGEGVRIAILDTGIGNHPDVASRVVMSMDLVSSRDAEPGVGTHGTAVASLITGHGDVRGVAPSAELIDIRVLDANGVGDVFTLAQGIVAAANLVPPPIINISLGAYGDAPVLQQAVQYAMGKGTVVLASVGNDGGDQVLAPATYGNVIGVGSFDADNHHAPFSNRGQGVTIGAPGVGLAAGTPDGGTFYFSGTSGSTPLISGGLAGYMFENPGMTPYQAVLDMLQFADDTGPPGFDPYMGAGAANFERALLRDVPGIHDVAVTSQYLGPVGSDGLRPLYVTVQNSGTETTGRVGLDIFVEGLGKSFQFADLSPGETGVAKLLIDPNEIEQLGSIRVESEANLLNREDSRPQNNTARSTFRP